MPDENRRKRYPPIEEHGVIGDLHTVALVATDGTIDWYCCPSFDSPSVFASILDADRGGHYRIAPAHTGARTKQLYFPDTNVLITRSLDPDGVCEVQDFMPIESTSGERHRHRLIRRVLCVRGTVDMRLECEPSFDYGRAQHTLELGDRGALFKSSGLSLSLSTPVPLEQVGMGVRAQFTLNAGESVAFVLERVSKGASIGRIVRPGEATAEFSETVEFWRRWVAQSQYRGRWREMVARSALTLKLLTYQPTGAIVAAPTTSLPEAIGGPRNWDYRYTWIRDAAFSLYALLRLGFTEEAGAFMNWLEQRTREREHHPDETGPLQIMYGDRRARAPAGVRADALQRLPATRGR